MFLSAKLKLTFMFHRLFRFLLTNDIYICFNINSVWPISYKQHISVSPRSKQDAERNTLWSCHCAKHIQH
jgi:hypothetical protein